MFVFESSNKMKPVTFWRCVLIRIMKSSKVSVETDVFDGLELDLAAVGAGLDFLDAGGAILGPRIQVQNVYKKRKLKGRTLTMNFELILFGARSTIKIYNCKLY